MARSDGVADMERTKQRRKPLAFVGAILAVLSLAGGVLVGLQPSGDPPPTPPSATPPGPPPLGVYAGPYGQVGVAEFETWLGRPVGRVLDYLGQATWEDIAAPHTPRNWQATDYDVVYSVPLLPETPGVSLAEGATGAYNEHFRALAERLVAHDQGDATIRLGWEFTGDWYPWYAGRDPQSFVVYWRHVVDTMRSVPGSAFTFDWNIALGTVREDGTPFPAELAYPGDAWVDYVGADTYDAVWGAHDLTPEQRWDRIVNQDHGLAWVRDFAAAQGKPVSVPEWGLWSAGNEYAGGGDNPYYVQKMHEWLGDNDVAYHVYFNFDAGGGDHELQDFPRAAARFRQLFGGTQ